MNCGVVVLQTITPAIKYSNNTTPKKEKGKMKKTGFTILLFWHV
jgi:hypothetical protein